MDKKKHEKTHEDKNKKEELDERYKKLEDQLKRTLADYQNLEKRVEENRLEWVKMANKQLLLRLLPGLDALLLAEKHTQDEGVKLSIKKILDSLEAEGVKKIETEGKDFDPNLMECVHAVEVDPSAGSGQEEGKVVEEVSPGYLLYDKVLRVAQVTVGKVEDN